MIRAFDRIIGLAVSQSVCSITTASLLNIEHAIISPLLLLTTYPTLTKLPPQTLLIPSSPDRKKGSTTVHDCRLDYRMFAEDKNLHQWSLLWSEPLKKPPLPPMERHLPRRRTADAALIASLSPTPPLPTRPHYCCALSNAAAANASSSITVSASNSLASRVPFPSVSSSSNLLSMASSSSSCTFRDRSAGRYDRGHNDPGTSVGNFIGEEY